MCPDPILPPRDVVSTGCFFTVFIPTYNRAALLPAALASIEALTCRDFEVIVVDDGSTDNTRAVVQDWIGKGVFPLRYVFQENQGMHASINTAADHARGFLTIRLDSDDTFLPDALRRIKARWDAIPDSEKPKFAGVSGLCLNDDGTVSGERYPRDVIDSDYLEIFEYCRMNGERREALRTEVMREFPYPRIAGERRMRSTLTLRRMAHRYKTRFTNDVLQVNRHAVGGITANRFKYRMLYPRGQRLYYLEEVTLNDRYSGIRKLFGQHARYVRYSLNCGIGLRAQAREVKHFWLWLGALLPGVLSWARDRVRMKLRGIEPIARDG